MHGLRRGERSSRVVDKMEPAEISDKSGEFGEGAARPACSPRYLGHFSSSNNSGSLSSLLSLQSDRDIEGTGDSGGGGGNGCGCGGLGEHGTLSSQRTVSCRTTSTAHTRSASSASSRSGGSCSCYTPRNDVCAKHAGKNAADKEVLKEFRAIVDLAKGRRRVAAAKIGPASRITSPPPPHSTPAHSPRQPRSRARRCMRPGTPYRGPGQSPERHAEDSDRGEETLGAAISRVEAHGDAAGGCSERRTSGGTTVSPRRGRRRRAAASRAVATPPPGQPPIGTWRSPRAPTSTSSSSRSSRSWRAGRKVRGRSARWRRQAGAGRVYQAQVVRLRERRQTAPLVAKRASPGARRASVDWIWDGKDVHRRRPPPASTSGPSPSPSGGRNYGGEVDRFFGSRFSSCSSSSSSSHCFSARSRLHLRETGRQVGLGGVRNGRKVRENYVPPARNAAAVRRARFSAAVAVARARAGARARVEARAAAKAAAATKAGARTGEGAQASGGEADTDTPSHGFRRAAARSPAGLAPTAAEQSRQATAAAMIAAAGGLADASPKLDEVSVEEILARRGTSADARAASALPSRVTAFRRFNRNGNTKLLRAKPRTPRLQRTSPLPNSTPFFEAPGPRWGIDEDESSEQAGESVSPCERAAPAAASGRAGTGRDIDHTQAWCPELPRRDQEPTEEAGTRAGADADGGKAPRAGERVTCLPDAAAACASSGRPLLRLSVDDHATAEYPPFSPSLFRDCGLMWCVFGADESGRGLGGVEWDGGGEEEGGAEDERDEKEEEDVFLPSFGIPVSLLPGGVWPSPTVVNNGSATPAAAAAAATASGTGPLLTGNARYPSSNHSRSLKSQSTAGAEDGSRNSTSTDKTILPDHTTSTASGTRRMYSTRTASASSGPRTFSSSRVAAATRAAAEASAASAAAATAATVAAEAAATAAARAKRARERLAVATAARDGAAAMGENSATCAGTE